MSSITLSRNELQKTYDAGTQALPFEGLMRVFEETGIKEGLPLKCDLVEVRIADGIAEKFLAKKTNALRILCMDGNKNRPPIFIVQEYIVGNRLSVQIYSNGLIKYELNKIDNSNAGILLGAINSAINNKNAKNEQEAKFYLDLMFDTIIPNVLNDPNVFDEPDTVLMSDSDIQSEPQKTNLDKIKEMLHMPDSSKIEMDSDLESKPDEKYENEPGLEQHGKPDKEETSIDQPQTFAGPIPDDPWTDDEEQQMYKDPFDDSNHIEDEMNEHNNEADDETEGHYLLYLTREEARKGCQKKIQFDGRNITVQVPSMAKEDTVIIVPNCGYKIESSGQRGNLRVELMLV